MTARPAAPAVRPAPGAGEAWAAPEAAAEPAGEPRRAWTRWLWPVLAAVLAGAVVAGGTAAGWRGVDLPAQLYRVELFGRHGFAWWDSQWFGGHWMFDYSVVVPAAAWLLGLGVLTTLAAAGAAGAFELLADAHFGRRGRAAAVVFAIGTAVPAAIGQVTFLVGVAAGLWSLLAASRRRWAPACVLAVVASLASPLAGGFLALAGAAAVLLSWWDAAGGEAAGLARLARRPLPALRAGGGMLGLTAAAVVPVAAMSLLFPGDGPMPFPALDAAWEVVVAAGLLVLTSGRDRLVRAGLALYLVAVVAAVALPSPLGGNVGRLEDAFALPLAAALCWPGAVGRSLAGSALGRARRALPLRRAAPGASGRWERVAGAGVAVAVATPLALSQWTPAWAAMTSLGARPWTHRAFYQPLVAWARTAPGRPGRLEVVPTAAHWEAAYVAPEVPLARGWERQLDEADAPVFYDPGALTPASYRAWLTSNGVRWVAVPAAPLDASGVGESRLVGRGLAYLSPVWSDRHWRVFAVAESPGIGGPGAQVVSYDGDRLDVRVVGAGRFVIRARYTPAWKVVAGRASIGDAAGGWLALTVPAGGEVRMRIEPFG